MTSKLPRPKMPSVPGVSRRAQYSASTKRSLLKAAEALFAAKGYAATSLDAIVGAAEVTKGALYHHFSGKQALFEAVFEEIEARATARITKAVKGGGDAWDKSLTGLHAFLEVVQEPAYRRVVMQEGPAVLGYERFREHEERSAYGLVSELVRGIIDAGGWVLDEPMREAFTRIFFGAVTAAGYSVSEAEDQAAASERAEASVALLLAGMRSLAGNDPGAIPGAPWDVSGS